MTTIFNDGFESGNFSAWTSSGSSGSTLSVVASPVHHGSYAMQVAGLGAAGENGYAHKSLAGTAFYARCYYFFKDSLPTSPSSFWTLAPAFTTTTATQRCASVIYDFANSKFGIRYYNSSGTFANVYEEGTTSLSADTWYCIELYINSADSGTVTLWVDGVQKATVSADTNTRTLAGVSVGNIYVEAAEASDKTILVDCVVVADAYIGPEAASSIKTVTDNLSLNEVLLRHKILSVFDSAGASEANVSRDKTPLVALDAISIFDSALANKSCIISDGLSLDESTYLPSRILKALDNIAISEDALIQKAIIIDESISLVEIVEAGGGISRKTRLYLVLGDLAIELTGN